MGRIGKYIYGVIDSGVQESIVLDGLLPFENLNTGSCQTIGSNGEISCRAYTISYRDVSAVVSDLEVVDYNHMPKDALAMLLVRHQQVIEKVMAEHSIIPVKIGTFAETEGDVEDILSRGYTTVMEIFEKVRGQIEIDVAVMLDDFSSFMQEISSESEIIQLKQSLLSKAEGVTVDDQIKLGILVKKHLDNKKAQFSERIRSALNECTQDFKIHDLMDDKMVLNTAFLIKRSESERFGRKVDELNNEFDEKLNFRCIGPLAPYSFYTLEVRKAQFEELDWARKKLGLTGDFLTAGEIKKAHHRMALTCHPDKKPDTPGIEEKFNDMTRAYKILLDYYRASSQSKGVEGCYLNEESFENNAMLVTTAH
jgi:hypothetical protein